VAPIGYRHPLGLVDDAATWLLAKKAVELPDLGQHLGQRFLKGRFHPRTQLVLDDGHKHRSLPPAEDRRSSYGPAPGDASASLAARRPARALRRAAEAAFLRC